MTTPQVYVYQVTVQGPDGYTDTPRTVTGPLYHGGRAILRAGGMLTAGRRTNPWGDEGARSTHVYFTTDPGTALAYAKQLGPRGRLYVVEPTGDFTKDYGPQDYKTAHPLRVVRAVPLSEVTVSVPLKVVSAA